MNHPHPVPVNVDFTVAGHQYSLLCFKDDYLHTTIRQGQLWERHITYFMAFSAWKPDSVFFDIGANVGYYSLLAERFLTTGKIVSVEPHPAIYAALTQNLGHFDPQRCTTIQAAIVGGGVSTTTIVFDEADSGASHVGEGGVTVDATTIDALSERFGLPSVVKMDIEGLEWDALFGAERTMREGAPTIVMEFAPDNAHRSRHSLEEGLRLAAGLGYQPLFFRGHTGFAAEPISVDLLVDLAAYWRKVKAGSHIDIVLRPKPTKT